MDEIFLTSDGAKKLKHELEHLTTVKRTELAARLRDAIKMGDLSENADYISAKEEQAFLEGKIMELQETLRRATVVAEGSGNDAVGIGQRVTVVETGADPETFILVGAKEANPREGKISHESPIGKVLMGKRVGDTAEAETPGGTIVFKVLKIE
ncbi:MAG: transcription elongation factor GreA [Chloroflexi bacterium]|nr:transcription elongation factor GreA [Chloroflexota bacterium]MBI3761772.1 transcription elongation factor GreA [Chloroflexota bacterium]